MVERYFIVETITGNVYNFDCECNEVNYGNLNYCVFKHVDDDKTYTTLAIIPHNQIKTIISRKGEDSNEQE